MKTLSLKRGSWHYKVATTFGWKECTYTYEDVLKSDGDDRPSYWTSRRVKVPGDFCSYIRHIIFGSLLALALVAVALILGSFSVMAQWDFLVYIYEAIICGNEVDFGRNNLAPIGLIIDVLLVVFLLIESVRRDWLTILAIPAWLKWCFKWLPGKEFRIPSCEEIPVCNDTKRFLIAAYTTFHDKVCFKLDFHNGSQEND